MRRTLLATVALSWLPAVALAHAHLLRSDPADGSEITRPLTSFVLEFSESARLTALTLQPDAGAAQKIGAVPSGESTRFAIAAPKLAAGHYTLRFRVLSADQHVVSGSIQFRITAAAAAP